MSSIRSKMSSISLSSTFFSKWEFVIGLNVRWRRVEPCRAMAHHNKSLLSFLLCSLYLLSSLYNSSMESFSTALTKVNVVRKSASKLITHYNLLLMSFHFFFFIGVNFLSLKATMDHPLWFHGCGNNKNSITIMWPWLCWPYLPCRLPKDGQRKYIFYLKLNS